MVNGDWLLVKIPAINHQYPTNGVIMIRGVITVPSEVITGAFNIRFVFAEPVDFTTSNTHCGF